MKGGRRVSASAGGSCALCENFYFCLLFFFVGFAGEGVLLLALGGGRGLFDIFVGWQQESRNETDKCVTCVCLARWRVLGVGALVEAALWYGVGYSCLCDEGVMRLPSDPC